MTTTADALKSMASLGDDEVVEVLGALFDERSSFRLMRDDLLATLGTALSAPRVRDALTQAALRDVTTAGTSRQAEQLRIEAEARGAVLSQPVLDSREVADTLGSRGQNRRDMASTLRRSGVVVGVPHGGKVWYPAFQLDVRRGQVRPVVKEVNELLGAAGDPWGVASWWLSPSGRRRDRKSPADLAVGGDDDAVRALAHTLVRDD
ncbi:MAG: hypothetical protein M3O94_04450 [Actinomycetota bacterium]|nr:hypothetical protein [Actinomycetota bacterium]